MSELNNLLKRVIKDKGNFVSMEKAAELLIELEDIQHQLEIQTKRVENLKKSNKFYADKSKWGYSSRPKNDSHKAWIIENYDCGWCPDNEKFVGGKLARSCQAIDQELEKQLEGVK